MKKESADPDITDWRYLATIHKKRKANEQELTDLEIGQACEWDLPESVPKTDAQELYVVHDLFYFAIALP